MVFSLPKYAQKTLMDQTFCVYFHSVELKFHSGDVGFWDCSKRENRHLIRNMVLSF